MTGAQLGIFDAAAGAALRERGISRIESREPTLFRRVLDEAIAISRRYPVHADDVRAFCIGEGITLSKSTLGAIFARKGWRKVGERASAFPACHGHKSGLYVWESEA